MCLDGTCVDRVGKHVTRHPHTYVHSPSHSLPHPHPHTHTNMYPYPYPYTLAPTPHPTSHLPSHTGRETAGIRIAAGASTVQSYSTWIAGMFIANVTSGGLNKSPVITIGKFSAFISLMLMWLLLSLHRQKHGAEEWSSREGHASLEPCLKRRLRLLTLYHSHIHIYLPPPTTATGASIWARALFGPAAQVSIPITTCR